MMLLEGGANPGVADNKGNTLMHTTESPELMAALLERGGDPNVTNQVDEPPSPLFVSVRLFRTNSNPNAPTLVHTR